MKLEKFGIERTREGRRRVADIEKRQAGAALFTAAQNKKLEYAPKAPQNNLKIS